MREIMFRDLRRRLAEKRLTPRQIQHLGNLERMASVGLRDCAFMSGRDERDAEFAPEMGGETMSQDTMSQGAARKVTLTRIDDMPAAVFKGDVR